MVDLSKKVFEKIKKDHLTPTSAWHYVLPNVLKWIWIVVVVIMAAVSTALILWEFQLNDVDMNRLAADDFWEFMYFNVPYLWVVLLIIFGGLAHLIYKYTKFGYRHCRWTVFTVLGGFIVLFGITLCVSELAEPVDSVLRENFSMYDDIEVEESQRWDMPSKGILVGSVTAVNDKIIVLERLNEEEWIVDISEVKGDREEKLMVGAFLRILGNQTGDYLFKASKIALWKRVFGGSRQES